VAGLRHLVALAAALALLPAAGAAAAPGASSLPAGFAQDVVVSGLHDPTAFAFLPDGRILIAEKAGVVRIVDGGHLVRTPFLDLRDRVNDYYERGLLGLARDPDFATNGYVYLLYPYENDRSDYRGTKTARLTRVTAAGDVAAPGSEVVLLGSEVGATCKQLPPGADCIPNDWYGHSVGDLVFARDGTLFLSVGDASTWLAATADSLRAQDLDSLAGKILHVTRNGEGLPSNPFWNGDPNAARSKVWAYGVRNAFRFGLRPGSGVLYVGDVGWDTTDEIDVVPAGSNLGWPCYEGSERQPRYEAMPECRALYDLGASAVRFPLLDLPNGDGSSVTGGVFYTGGSFPRTYRGAYFFGDWARSVIRFLRVDAGDRLVGAPASFAAGADGPVQMAVGPGGDLYYLAYNAGELRRIRYGKPSGGHGASRTGLFGRRTSYPVGRDPHSVVTADVNRDGKLDLVVADSGSDDAAVLLGAGNGSFLAARRFRTGHRPKYVTASDLDGDGTVDLASANQDASTASVLLGAGDGTFAAPVDYPVCSRPHEIAAGDLDGDGRRDLAVACWNGSVVSVLRGRGDGTFDPPVSYESGASPHSLVIRDLDRDGRRDLAVANHGDDTVAVLLGRRDGTLGAPVRYPVGSLPHAIRAGDLDRDGTLDLVTANNGSDTVSVLLGHGDGTFAPARSYRTGRVPKSLVVADVDGDRRLDVVTGNTGGNGDGIRGRPGGDLVSVLLGTGTGGLLPPIAYLVGQTPFSVAAGRFDGDRRLDLATANWDSRNVSVLLGRR
jgi:glucose/arabinose dehydrogenase